MNSSANPSFVLPGLDRVHAYFNGQSDAIAPAVVELLKNGTLGLLTNQTGYTRDGQSALKVLCSGGCDVRTVFSPEHGPQGTLEGEIESGQTDDGRPIYSLYGATRRPTSEMLAGSNAIVYDLQDVGARFYTYSTTLAYLLEECTTRGIAVVVLDRPNPLGDSVEGPLLEDEHRSFVGYIDEPVTHGMTLGELARFHAANKSLDIDLHVVPVQNWTRAGAWPTDLAWLTPSPNLPDWQSAAWYPGACLLEFSGVSVGRGTDAPFQIMGAPWLEPSKVLEEMQNWPAALRDEITAESITYMPTRATWENTECRGLRFSSSEGVPSRPVALGLAMLATLHHTHPQFDEVALKKSLRLLGSSRALELLARNDIEAALALSQSEAALFRTRRTPFLEYA